MSMVTEIQQREQTEGPGRPKSEWLGLLLLRSVPAHVEIRAISINGQTGRIVVETYHEGLEQSQEFYTS